MTSPTTRVVSLRWPNDVIEAVDEACEAAGETRTGWVMDACRRKLEDDEARNAERAAAAAGAARFAAALAASTDLPVDRLYPPPRQPIDDIT